MTPATGDRLDSWKEIAAYLNRGVRTVRRWEDQEGLPVHRLLHRTLGSVYAFKSEIDAWRGSGARVRAPRRSAAPSIVDAAPSRAKSIVVLPFANLSTDPDNAYFADGLTDEVISDLSKVRALRVISRTSSMTLKGTTKDVKTIARELDVAYVLEGSVRREGGRLRITAQLIDGGSDAHLWAGKYDGSAEDVFAFQERLARTIVGALELRLTSEEERRLAHRPIANLLAYECYMRARQEGWRWRADAIDHAVQLLRNGLEIVGDNAELEAALGLAHLQYREAGIDLGERPLRLAEECANKAFRLAPASAAALRLRGWIHYSRALIQDAVRDLKAAIDLDPNNADALGLLANCYLISGHGAAARPVVDRLLAVDPLTPVNRCMPGFADIMDGRFDTAVEPYRRMLEMDPGNPMARLFYIWVLILNRSDGDVAQVAAGFSPDVAETIPARLAAFLVHALTGDFERAHALVTPDLEAVATASDVFPRLLAQGFALAGQPRPALHWLKRAIARGFINYPFLSQYDPFFQPFRADPEFIRLMDNVRQRWEQFEL